MEATDNTYDVRVRIEDTANIYVGEKAREAMQDDARRQLHTGIYEAQAAYEATGFDQTDLETLRGVVWPLTRALDAVKALQALAPLPPDPDDGSNVSDDCVYEHVADGGRCPFCGSQEASETESDEKDLADG